ncbi:MAG: alanine--tRNA ligase-related protein [Bacteroidota bacterium]
MEKEENKFRDALYKGMKEFNKSSGTSVSGHDAFLLFSSFGFPLEMTMELAKEKGMNGLHGPMGFCDMDNEGMLVKGYDEIHTMASIYNYPYYVVHMEKYGFFKAADWVQWEFEVSPEIPDKVDRLSQLVQEKYHLHILKAKKPKDLLPYAKKMFTLQNAAFSELYGFVPLTDKQMKLYTKQYFGFIRAEFVSFVLDEHDEIVGFGVSLPSLSKALQKCNGHLFPFGWYHLLRAMKKNDTIDMYLNGVRPDFQGKGINSLYYNEMHKAYLKYGIKKAVTSPQLEDNAKALTIWKNFKGRQHMTRRCWKKEFGE